MSTSSQLESSVPASPAVSTQGVRSRRRFFPTRVERRQMLLALIFISPWLVGLAAFTIYPIYYTIRLSFTRYGGLGTPTWVGLDNYRFLLHDATYHQAVTNTIFYTLLAVPIGVVVAIVLALCMNQDLPEIPIYRTILYLPSVLPLVALSFVALVLLDPNNGIFNQALRQIGLNPPNWLGTPTTAKVALVGLAQFGAGQIALIFLAGLKGIPQSLYEAAMIDGASAFNRFRNITIPLLTPVILYDLIVGISGGLQVFTQSFIITQGGPAGGTTFVMNYLYNNAFRFGGNMGYASAQGVVIFVVTFLLAGLIFFTSRRWVNYDLT